MRRSTEQLSAEQIGDVPQFREETVDEISLVPRKRVQQLTAEQIGDVPRIREDTVETVKKTIQEGISGRNHFIGVPKTTRRRSAEVAKHVFQKSISERSQAMEVTKNWRQRSVEAVKSIPQERSPERRCEQSEVTEVTETPSQDIRLRTLEQLIPGEGLVSIDCFKPQTR